MTESASLRALALVCSLKPLPAPSSSDLMARQILEQLAKHGVTGDVVRVIDHDVKPGVEIDMGEGDAWPAVREQLIVATPTWVGHMSSVAQRVLERLDGELSDLMQGLDDFGFTIPAQGTCWNDVAMGGRDYLDLDETPEAVASTNATLAENAADPARLLKSSPYPG
jgi:multimeric flavodoxin WrbA